MFLALFNGSPLPWLPKFVISSRSIFLASYTNATEYDHHIATTLGSGGTFGFKEAIRFDRDSGKLVSAWLHFPENLEAPNNELEAILAQPAVPSRLRLTSHGIDVDWPRAFSIDSSCSWLAATLREFSRDQKRILAAPDFDFLFDGTIVGWILHHPARYLCQNWSESPEPTDNASTSAFLKEFLMFMDRDLLEQLDDGDTKAICKLRDLEQRMLRPQSPQDIALHKAVLDTLETFASSTSHSP